jgi:hypothetical protein
MCHNFFFKNIKYRKASLDGLKLYLFSFSFMDLPNFQDSRGNRKSLSKQKEFKKEKLPFKG